MSDVDLAKIKYSLRTGCFHSACQDAENALKRGSGNREILVYYKAVSRAMNGCVDELELLRKTNRGKLEFSIICALQYFYTELGANEKKVEKLKIGSKAAFQCISVEGAVLAAEFSIWISHDYFETSRCLDEISALQPDIESEVQRLRLWFEVVSNEEFVGIDTSLQLERAQESKDIDCLMALARYQEMRGNMAAALNTLRKIKSLDSSFFPAFIEISKVHLAMASFTLAEESSRIASGMANSHIEAQYVLTMTKCFSRCDKRERHACLQNLMQLCINQEVTLSSKLWLRSWQFFSRVCGHDKITLQVILDTMTKILDESMPVGIALEYARTLRCLGRYGESLSQYQLALLIDDSNTAEGIVLCQALSGEVEQADHQIEFIELMQEEDSPATVEIMYAKVVVDSGRDGCCFEEIFKTVELALTPFQAHGGALGAYGTCDLSLLLLLIQHLVYHCEFAQSNEHESRIRTILIRIISLYPSNVEAHCLLSKVQLELNDHEAFQSGFTSCLKQGHELTLVKITKAQYYLSTGQIKIGLDLMEEVLSADFAIQNHPYFCFVKGSLLLETGEVEAADTHLSKVLHHLSTAPTNPMITLLTKQDTILCFVSKGKILKKQERVDCMDDLVALMDKIFTGTNIFACLKAKSDLLLEMGNVENALELFDNIPTASNDYTSAQMAKADIYLKQNDKSEYIKCFRRLSDMNESAETLAMLGDACVKIGVPSAMKAYNRALDYDPLNEDLVLKIGSIHIDTNKMDKAVNIFTRYLKRAPQSITVKMKLIHLYSILEYDKEALHMLQSFANKQEEGQSLDREAYVQLLIATADIYCRKEQYKKARDCLMQGIDMLENMQPKQERKTIAMILSKLADCHSYLGSIQLAVESIQSALQIHPKCQRYCFQLTTFLYQNKQYDECILKCEEHYAHSEETMLLITDSLMKKTEYEIALKKCAACYKKHKNYYRLICKYIMLLQKMGDISSVKAIYNDMKTLELEGITNEGQHMCTGLCKQFLGDPVGALVSFNTIRKTEEWSHESLRNMIRIYLRMGDFDYWSSLQIKLDVDEALEAADMLLSILEKSLPRDREVSILRGYWEMIALGGNLDKPLARFNQLLQGDEVRTKCLLSVLRIPIERYSKDIYYEKNYIPALLAFAILMQGDSSTKIVRNTLKKIAKMPFDASYFMEFEISYLLLAEDYVERGKIDLAHDLAKRCLYYNKSSIKAWEIFGKTVELQDGSWNDIVQSYEKCWSLGNKTSRLSGYRLSALYLKLNEFTDAMNILPHLYFLAPENCHVKSLVSTLASSLRP